MVFDSDRRTRVPSLLFSVCVVLWLGARTNSSEAADASRPNILFILSDDQRWDALGAENNTAIQTPNLDALAKSGVLFRQASVVVSLCCPSRAALLTGLLPHQSGYYSNKMWTIDAGNGFTQPTAVELLRRSGYHTCLVGKWHIKPAPWRCGFDEVRMWMPHGADKYVNAELAHGKSEKINETPGHVSDLFTTDAVAFLKDQARSGAQQPFFMWLAYTEPHSPMKPVPERCCEPYKTLSAEHTPPGFPPDERAGDSWAKYYSAITHLDEQCGIVLKTLAESGLADNTVVVYLSDNGWLMGSHGYYGKMVPMEESVRVPLIIKAPPALQKWTGISDALVASTDLTATWLAIAGVTVPPDCPGESMLPLLASPAPKPAFRDDLFCEFEDEITAPGYAFRSIRTQDWKYILRPHRAGKAFKKMEEKFEEAAEEKRTHKAPVMDEEQLFDLKNDPFEFHDLIHDPAAKEALRIMRLRLEGWMRRTDDPALDSNFPVWTLRIPKDVERRSGNDDKQKD